MALAKSATVHITALMLAVMALSAAAQMEAPAPAPASPATTAVPSAVLGLLAASAALLFGSVLTIWEVVGPLPAPLLDLLHSMMSAQVGEWRSWFLLWFSIYLVSMYGLFSRFSCGSLVWLAVALVYGSALILYCDVCIYAIYIYIYTCITYKSAHILFMTGFSAYWSQLSCQLYCNIKFYF